MPGAAIAFNRDFCLLKPVQQGRRAFKFKRFVSLQSNPIGRIVGVEFTGIESLGMNAFGHDSGFLQASANSIHHRGTGTEIKIRLRKIIQPVQHGLRIEPSALLLPVRQGLGKDRQVAEVCMQYKRQKLIGWRGLILKVN